MKKQETRRESWKGRTKPAKGRKRGKDGKKPAKKGNRGEVHTVGHSHYKL